MKSMRRGSMMQLLRGTTAWGAVALAAFYLNFVAVHLATETHFHGEDHSHAHTAESDQDHDGGEHTPHDATEHLLDVALKGADVLQAPALAIISEILILDAPAAFTCTQPLFERERPPGESPPDPQRPRAPPLS